MTLNNFLNTAYLSTLLNDLTFFFFSNVDFPAFSLCYHFDFLADSWIAKLTYEMPTFLSIFVSYWQHHDYSH